MSSEEPLMYSQFCYTSRRIMHIPRKPGEQIEVDGAGDPAHIIDPTPRNHRCMDICRCIRQYAFVKAYMNEKNRQLIKAHVQMFDFFGGVHTYARF